MEICNFNVNLQIYHCILLYILYFITLGEKQISQGKSIYTMFWEFTSVPMLYYTFQIIESDVKFLYNSWQ